MAITKSAKKAIRVAEKKAVFNTRRKASLKGAIKDIKKAISAKDAKLAEEKLRLAYKALDKAAKTGLIKKGNASRKKSRLAKALAKTK